MDVEEPDEKSLITYVSSLYDVFPDVPSKEQSFRDDVRFLLDLCFVLGLPSYVVNAEFCRDIVVYLSSLGCLMT